MAGCGYVSVGRVAAGCDGAGAGRAGRRLRAGDPRSRQVLLRPDRGRRRRRRGPRHRPRRGRPARRQRDRRHREVLGRADAGRLQRAVREGQGLLLGRPGRRQAGPVHRRRVRHPRQRLLLPRAGHRGLGPEGPVPPAAEAVRRLPGRDGARARVGARDPEAHQDAERPDDRGGDAGGLLRRLLDGVRAEGRRPALRDRAAGAGQRAVRLPALPRPARRRRGRPAGARQRLRPDQRLPGRLRAGREVLRGLQRQPHLHPDPVPDHRGRAERGQPAPAAGAAGRDRPTSPTTGRRTSSASTTASGRRWPGCRRTATATSRGAATPRSTRSSTARPTTRSTAPPARCRRSTARPATSAR